MFTLIASFIIGLLSFIAGCAITKEKIAEDKYIKSQLQNLKNSANK